MPATMTRDLQEAILAWLAPWFNGATHTVAGQAVVVPSAAIGFDQVDLAQPLGGVGITWVLDRGHGVGRIYMEDGHHRDVQPVGFLVLVRAAGQTEGGRSAALRARVAADCLRWIILDPAAAQPMAEAGLTALESVLPREAASGDFHLWVMRVTGRLHRIVTTSATPSLVTPAAQHPVGADGLARRWHDWVSGYFDGATHTVCGEAKVFPTAKVHVGRHAAPRPNEEPGVPTLEIEFQVESRGNPKAWLEDGQRRVHETCVVKFFIHSRHPDPATAKHECRRAADLLYAIATDGGCRLALARWGISDFRTDNPTAIGGLGESVRGMNVEFRLFTQIPI